MAVDPALQIAIDHHNAGRVAEAINLYNQILARQPDHAEAMHMLGVLAAQCGKLEPAADLMRRSFRAGLANAEAHNNFGCVLRELGALDEAESEFHRALELKPAYAAAYRNLANVQNDRGRPDLAVDTLRRAVALDPSAADVHSSLLYSLQFHPAYDPAAILAEHRKWADRHARPLYDQRKSFPNSRLGDRRIRVGYVSPDFCNHVAGRMIKPLLAHHDRRQFAVICYANVPAPDAVTAELKSMADEWYSCYQISDEQLAKNVRKNGIDILVDLAQHSGGNRLLAFARKPAPVQVTWLGYPGTTGMDTIDYRLTDPYLDPFDHAKGGPPAQCDEYYSEKSWRLPHSFWCYQPLDGQNEAVGPPPALRNGFVTFGCMNRFAKVTPPTLELWRRILQRVPESRLRLHSKIGSHLGPVREFFRQGGIASDRITFVERLPVADYIRQYHEIDICLDPIPHGGGTTTGDALWMGVPVVTLAGRTAVGRGGASILSNAGLPEFIARSSEEYISLAVALAADSARREHLRACLRAQLKGSVLMDGRQFASDIEAAYRSMWRTWCESSKR